MSTRLRLSACLQARTVRVRRVPFLDMGVTAHCYLWTGSASPVCLCLSLVGAKGHNVRELEQANDGGRI